MKSEDGDFPSYRGQVFILLTPESCDSYRKFLQVLLTLVPGMLLKFCSFHPISLIFLTYVLLSYFVHLYCANIHIHLPSFSFL